jgi:hypothetical protein
MRYTLEAEGLMEAVECTIEHLPEEDKNFIVHLPFDSGWIPYVRRLCSSKKSVTILREYDGDRLLRDFEMPNMKLVSNSWTHELGEDPSPITFELECPFLKTNFHPAYGENLLRGTTDGCGKPRHVDADRYY